MPPNKSVKLIQSVSPFEGDPISRSIKKREQAKELSSDEVAERNDRLNTELSAMYGDIDSSVSEHEVDKVSENPENNDEMVIDNDSLKNFHSKIANEVEDVFREVLKTLEASGMPESEINDSSRANIYKRIMAEIDDVAKSGVDVLDTESAGGNILSNESRNQVIKAVLSEEVMDFYRHSPEEALNALPASTIKEMYGHLNGGAAELRTNDDLALLGEKVYSNEGESTLESQVEYILVEESSDAEAETASGIEVAEIPSLDQAREEALQVYEEMGGDITQKREELGLSETQEVSLDSGMLAQGDTDYQAQAINHADIKR